MAKYLLYIIIALIFFFSSFIIISARIVIENPDDIIMPNMSENNNFLHAYSPNNYAYYKKKVDFNLSSDDLAIKIEYINLNEQMPKWKTLCTNCREYGLYKDKKLTMVEGENQIIIRAYNLSNNFSYKEVILYVESNQPIIYKIEPREGKITNGSSFSIEYTEENLQNITLVYGKINLMKKTIGNCSPGKNIECIFNLNLSEYENEEIYYYFIINDLVLTKETKPTKIKVDTITPEIKVFYPVQNKSYEKFVLMNITSSEKSTILYKDENDKNPAFRSLCINCESYGYYQKKTKVFQKGEHKLMFKAVDKSGNMDFKEVSIMIE